VVSELFDTSSIARLSRPDGEAAIRSRCAAHYLGDHEVLCRCLGRYKMFLDSRDVGFTPHIMMDGYWEYWITQFIVNNIQPGFWVLDIGANFGYYSLLFSDLVGPYGRCLAFEPNPQVAAKLRKSISINGFDGRADVKEVALGREAAGEVRFFIPYTEPKNARVVASEDGYDPNNGHVITVHQTTVDSICHGIDRLDFVKIDAEGAEAHIIDGMDETFKRLKPCLLLEFNMSRSYCGKTLVEHLLNIYGSAMYVDFDAKPKPVPIQDLAEKNVGQDWMLYFSG
jgi:FkbM family methyltransferase